MNRFRLLLSLGAVREAVAGVQQALANVPEVAADFGTKPPATACSPADSTTAA